MNAQIWGQAASELIAISSEWEHLRRKAEASVEAFIEASSKRLIEEPWRVSRIIRGANSMTFGELCSEVSRRFDIPFPHDYSKILALKQVLRAIETEGFQEAWEKYRAALPGSSTVEPPTVNRVVAGSSPALAANPETVAYLRLRAEVQRQHGRTRDVDEARKRLTTMQLKKELGRV